MFNYWKTRQFQEVSPSKSSSYPYRCITPHHTVKSVPRSEVIFRFSPSGEQLVTFSQSYDTLFVYRYRGVDEEAVRRAPLASIFDKILQLEHTIPSPDPQFIFCPDSCFLFTDNSLFLLVLAVREASSEDTNFNSDFSPEFLRSREGYLGAASNLVLEGSPGKHEHLVCSLVLVSLRTGKAVRDVDMLAVKRRSKARLCVELSVWLHGNTLALLSPVRQNVFFIRIKPDGKFGEICDPISYFLSYADHETILAHPSYTPLPQPAHVFPPSMMSQLQQKIFVRLYHQHSKLGRVTPLYRLWEALRTLRIWRIQLLDEDTLFLRFRQTHSSKGHPIHPISMWVIYRYEERRVLQVFCDQLDDLKQLLAYCEQLLPAFCQHIRYNLWYSSRSKLVWGGAPNASKNAVRQLMERYPVRLHRMPSYSPYLDRRLYFSNQLLPLTYWSKSGEFDESICFFNARTLNFSFDLGLSLSSSPFRELTLIPHPFDYFIISGERDEFRVEFNFHMRFKGDLQWEPSD